MITAFGHTYTTEADALARLEWLQAEDERRGGSDDCRTEIILLTESLEAHRATAVETPAPVQAPRVRPLLKWTVTRTTNIHSYGRTTATRVETDTVDGRHIILQSHHFGYTNYKNPGGRKWRQRSNAGKGGWGWQILVDGEVAGQANNLPDAKAAAETIAKAGK